MNARQVGAVFLAAVLGPSCYRSSGLGSDADTDADIDADADGDTDTGSDTDGVPFIVPDTNQLDCLHPPAGNIDPYYGIVCECGTIPEGDPLFGQDGHYLSPPRQPDFHDNGDGTVTDNVTGLVWQRCAAGLEGADCGEGELQEDIWSWAEGFCADLVLAGWDDWRLPSRLELAHLVDASRQDPAIDPEAFPNTPPARFWTATTIGTGSFRAPVDFETGRLGSGMNSFETHPVRCVRGAPLVPGPFTAAVVDGDRLVEDAATGLVWQGCLPGMSGDDCGEGSMLEFGWWGALAYCESLVLGGHDDWRVPDRNEIQTLFDFSGDTPFVNKEAFHRNHGNPMWTSSFVAGNQDVDAAWSAAFDSGVLQYASPLNDSPPTVQVRCVRGGP